MNALAVVAGVVWVVCGFYVLAVARRAEMSLRVLLAFGLIAAGALALAAAWRGDVELLGGLAMLAAAALTVLVVRTRPGRRAAGLDGLGLTEHSQLDDGEQRGVAR